MPTIPSKWNGRAGRSAPALGAAAAGVLLLGASLFGMVHALRVSLAQILYYQAAYGSACHNPNAILRRASSAHRLYPHNFLFCLRAGEKAFAAAIGTERIEARETFFDAAERWCDEGLELNRFKSRLHILKTRLIERRSPAEACRYWRQYLDWHFWEPRNHARLVELCARAGDFEGAMESLKWVEGSPYYQSATQALRAAWELEKLPPATGEGGRPRSSPPSPADPDGEPAQGRPTRD